MKRRLIEFITLDKDKSAKAPTELKLQVSLKEMYRLIYVLGYLLTRGESSGELTFRGIMIEEGD